MAIRIAIIGHGKIARDQHVPAIAGNGDFELVAVTGPHLDPATPPRAFTSHRALFAEMAGRLDAVAICTPPKVRHDIARDALAAGLHVLLEKPPTATLGEIEHLETLARDAGRTLFTAWHAQHNAAVAAAAEALAGKTVTGLEISWLEDVRKWHPGQGWIWRPGGFGVFDPGINALSIATRILPMPLFVAAATLSYPSNKQAPIAARLDFAGEEGAMRALMDWRFTAGEQWVIRIETTDGGKLELRDGGAMLLIDGAPQPPAGLGEYPSIYARFADLIGAGHSEVDREPLRIVADAFMVGGRELIAPFT
jgi:D-galactose 1-dehydrogenase